MLIDFMYRILNFVFVYPALMSLFWMAVALRFYRNFVRLDKKRKFQTNLPAFPKVSILIPCYNEEAVIEDTIEHMVQDLTYPDYEIICIDDGSKDKTWELLLKLNQKYPDAVRIIKIVNNAGKAHALIQGSIAAKGEFLLGVDADSFLESDAIEHLMASILGLKSTVSYFLGTERKGIGAVTGNPLVRNRSTLLGKVQIIEYASIIGLIKRAQRIYGRIGTLSGVCVMYRKRALMEVDWWDQDMITEDIATTWKLQIANWDCQFDPSAIVWMLVPETVKGLYKQRFRWSQGGAEVFLKNMDVFYKPNKWYQLPLLVEQFISLFWSYLWYLSLFVFFRDWYINGEPNWIAVSLGVGLVLICYYQLWIANIFSKRYDPLQLHYIFWAGWYPIVYWLVNPLTVVFAFPVAIKRMIKGGQATWTSPDRGISKIESEEKE